MKKFILSFAVISCLVLSFTACGGDSTTDGSASSAAASSAVSSSQADASQSDSDSDLPTLEDFFNSDIMQTMVDATKEQYETQGISADLYAQGDELIYEFTMDDIETTEEERGMMAETLKATTEENSSSFYDTALQAKEAVSNEEVIVVISYFDSAGNEIYSQSFSSADAQ